MDKKAAARELYTAAADLIYHLEYYDADPYCGTCIENRDKTARETLARIAKQVKELEEGW